MWKENNKGTFAKAWKWRSRSQWPRHVRRGPAAARFLQLWVQILPEASKSMSCVVQVHVSATCQSLVQRSPTEYCVCHWVFSSATVILHIYNEKLWKKETGKIKRYWKERGSIENTQIYIWFPNTTPLRQDAAKNRLLVYGNVITFLTHIKQRKRCNSLNRLTERILNRMVEIIPRA